jgi:potassium/hydrogen antiporter
MPPIGPLFIVAVLLLVSVVGGKVSGRFGIPALLLFLAIGMLAGSDGPGGIEFTDAELASEVGAIALAFILFAGGLDTRWHAVRPVLGPGVVLATVGTVITALVAGLAASLIFGVPVALGLLVGAIISSTDAAAVFSVLRSRGMGLRGRLRPLLELESASNDPMAVFLTIGFTALVTQPDASLAGFAWLFVRQMTLGAIAGIVLAWLAVRLINWLRLEYEGLYPVLTVAVVLGIFATTAALGGSGFLAVYLAGITMARHRFIHKRSLTRFHDGIGWLMQITMFLILGLLVFPSQLPSVAGPGLALAAVLMLVARPVAVWLSLLGSSWSAPERWLVSWVGLRGAVPIILATFPLAAGVEGADTIFNAVFFVVFLSVALQGTTIPPVARFLGLEAPGPDRTGEREEIVVGGITGRLLGETVVPPDSWAAGRQVVELDLPPGTWVALLTRGEKVVVPQGPTVLEAGDRLTVLATPAELEQVARHLATPSGR